MTTVDVCICTFRRASIAETLRSLATLTLAPGVELRVIVADNDDTDHARASIVAEGSRLDLDLAYVHAPARNISLARNAALDVATAEWIAVIDDDEVAEPGWLTALLATAQRTGADVVLGPVVAHYGSDAPGWMREGDLHSAAPVRVDGVIRTGYTSNVLFRRTAAPLVDQRFRLDLGRSGGEDTEFFYRAHRAGARIEAAADAIVSEEVPAARAALSWLVRRKFRSGQSHALLLLSHGPGRAGLARELALAAAKCAASGGGALITAPSARRRAFWLLRAALHAGVVSRLLGMRKIVLYGESGSVAAP